MENNLLLISAISNLTDADSSSIIVLNPTESSSIRERVPFLEGLGLTGLGGVSYNSLSDSTDTVQHFVFIAGKSVESLCITLNDEYTKYAENHNVHNFINKKDRKNFLLKDKTICDISISTKYNLTSVEVTLRDLRHSTLIPRRVEDEHIREIFRNTGDKFGVELINKTQTEYEYSVFFSTEDNNNETLKKIEKNLTALDLEIKSRAATDDISLLIVVDKESIITIELRENVKTRKHIKLRKLTPYN